MMYKIYSILFFCACTILATTSCTKSNTDTVEPITTAETSKTTGGGGTTTGGGGTTTGGGGTTTGGGGTTTGGGGTTTGGGGTTVITDTQVPYAVVLSPAYGGTYSRGKTYTIKANLIDDVKLTTVNITIRRITNNVYFLNKTITLPAGTGKTFVLDETFVSPSDLPEIQNCVLSITVTDATNKKSAVSQPIYLQ